MIVEVVSPDSIERDWFDKFADYERSGVGEYWVIDQLADRAVCYKRGADGRYKAARARGGRIASSVLRGFYLRPEWVLGRALPSLLDVLRELKVIR